VSDSRKDEPLELKFEDDSPLLPPEPVQKTAPPKPITLSPGGGDPNNLDLLENEIRDLTDALEGELQSFEPVLVEEEFQNQQASAEKPLDENVAGSSQEVAQPKVLKEAFARNTSETNLTHELPLEKVLPQLAAINQSKTKNPIESIVKNKFLFVLLFCAAVSTIIVGYFLIPEQERVKFTFDQKMIDPLLSSSSKPKEIENIPKKVLTHFTGSNNFDWYPPIKIPQTSSELKLSFENETLNRVAFSLSDATPPKLTPKDIIAGLRPETWIKRVSIEGTPQIGGQVNLINSDSTSASSCRVARVRGNAYCETPEGPERILIHLLIAFEELKTKGDINGEAIKSFPIRWILSSEDPSNENRKREIEESLCTALGKTPETQSRKVERIKESVRVEVSGGTTLRLEE
jgi:hypothetical protein